MRYADQALLSGCSGGGLAAILRYDEFRNLFPGSTKVKCLSDAGLFLDKFYFSSKHKVKHLGAFKFDFQSIVEFQSVKNNLPRLCTNHLLSRQTNKPFFI
ncbi:unnamed protein product [Brassica napus]|uniref:Pectin acetylesterase n=1 Tax=Brassica napus TaxID=3708 RepID=A0A816R793_BRANA|nr:unnamed protein product [Brassica napus]